ncbi:MAG: hypothetical protein WCQ50_05235 [Spirochaetota bacterium]
MKEELFPIPDAQKSRGKSRADEVKRGTLDESLAEIPVVREEKIDKAARLEDREPGLGGVVGQAAVEGQRAQVEDLTASRRAHLHKGLELAEILDV